MSSICDRVCRLCLSSRGELLQIFHDTSPIDTDPPVLVTKIKECVAVQINENDDLPTKVCRKCVDNVNNWHIFKTVCDKSQNKLQSMRNTDGSLLEEVDAGELSDEAYDDGVAIEASYAANGFKSPPPSKAQPEGPPILASLGLTPRSDKGVESEKDEESETRGDEMVGNEHCIIPNIPDVSITAIKSTPDTVLPRANIQEIASKACILCGREYRYAHNARRHELMAHNFDRYTNKIVPKKSHNQYMPYMQPKLRPNPFNPKARLMPKSHKIHQLLPKSMPSKMIPHKMIPKGIPIRSLPPRPSHKNLPYPLRIKALKDLQIKKKEPQILKTLLTSKPEVLVSEPEIIHSGPGSPETLISEPEIASFQVETILSEPDALEPEMAEEDEEGEDQAQRENSEAVDVESDHDDDQNTNNYQDNNETVDADDNKNDEEQENYENGETQEDLGEESESLAKDEVDHESQDYEEDSEFKNEHATQEEEENEVAEGVADEVADEGSQQEYNEDDGEEREMPFGLAPVVEINEETPANNELDDQHEEDLDESAEANDAESNLPDETASEVDPNKVYVTKAQKQFIEKYCKIIKQVNTMRCICCDREYPRRKAVIQHLQKNGHKVPKHTCYKCIITFNHIGALLSHMRANVCTELWKIVYSEDGITEDMVLSDEPKEDKNVFSAYSARSYACRLCPAKFQLKQFITKHVLDVHEDGQSAYFGSCVHCRSKFKSRSSLKRHVRSGDCIIDIACDICPERFSSIPEFNNHALALHVGKNESSDNQSKCVDGRPTNCPLCDKKLTSYMSVVKHLRVYHNEDRPHYCQNCDEKFDKADDLNNHIYASHSNKAMGIDNQDVDMSIVKEEAEEYHYSCTECNAIFETVDAWTDHQVAEHNQIAHHCDQCDKKFLRPSELAEHKNTHLRVKLYPCSLCSDSYSTPQKLSEHVQQAHPGAGVHASPDTQFYCGVCIRSFKSRQAYSNHMRIHSKVPTTNKKPGEMRSFAPQIIGKPIKHISTLVPGFVQFKSNCNVPNAPYSCDICGKGFMHKKNIWKHKKVLHADIVGERNDSEENTMQASTEEDEFNADENGSALSTPQFNIFNFTNYNNSQAGVATFTCEICYKKFPLKSSLWKHKRAKHGITNTTLPPGTSITPAAQPTSSSGESSGRTKCTICKLTFSDKKSYYRHRKNVHKAAPQVCKICGVPLSSTLELYEHLKAAHARELLGYNDSQVTVKSQPQEAPQSDNEYDAEPDANDPNGDYHARYPCDTCGRQFIGLVALQNHPCVGLTGSQSQTFDCEICHKSYTSIAALKSHRGWHLRSPDGKAAANNTGLWMPHHKVTQKVSKHEVLDAPKSSVTVAKRRLPPEVEVTVVNPNKKMRSEDSEMDIANMSTGADDKYCNICDKEFTKRAAYQRHMDEVHQPNSVFCPVCEKSFTRKSTLLVHMRKHYEGGEGSSSGIVQDGTGSRGASRYQAEESADSEEEEEEEEASAPPPPGEFTCGQCGDGVATPRDLIAHRTMHATPSKYFCHVCKVYFARNNDLATHNKARHSEAEKSFFPCAMCDRFYTNKKSLQKHIEMAH